MQVAQKMWDIGRLESDGDDYMMIHTKEAMRLFIGRGENPDGRVVRIPGAKIVGSALRQLWFNSGTDNPYADWALLMAEQGLDQRIKEMEQERERATGRIKELEQRGLHLSILRSANPVKLELGFRSPYGFLIAHLVIVFDHFVRIIKTLQARDLIGADEGRSEVRGAMGPIRALFNKVQRQEMILNRPAFNGIQRADFASTSVEVRQRISEINALWPGLPDEIRSGKLLPRHAKRQHQQPMTIANVATGNEEEAGLI
jgi:integrating conjugative element protein (TIGR03761 family)